MSSYGREASLDAWKTTPPEEARCTCDREECEECQAANAKEDAYDRHIDMQIDAARGK